MVYISAVHRLVLCFNPFVTVSHVHTHKPMLRCLNLNYN